MSQLIVFTDNKCLEGILGVEAEFRECFGDLKKELWWAGKVARNWPVRFWRTILVRRDF